MPKADDRLPTGAAMVTGGARRIGREIALTLARAGRPVVVHFNHSADDAALTVRAIEGLGGRAVAVTADLADADAAAGLIARASAAIGMPIDCLVNNASIFAYDRPRTFKSDDFDRNMAIHVRAPALLAQGLAAQRPKLTRGVIVNLLDQKSFNPDAAFFSYTISKHALLGLTHVLARALAPGIRVNGVALGMTLAPPGMSDEKFQEIQAGAPLGRGASPAEIARAVLFLIESEAVTGETLLVDGGEHMGRSRA